MKTYLLYQNGKLIMKEKQENKKKLLKIIPNLKKNTQPVLQFYQKERSLVAPPLTDSLKKTHIAPQSTISTKPDLLTKKQ
jgi:regulator of sigma D